MLYRSLGVLILAVLLLTACLPQSSIPPTPEPSPLPSLSPSASPTVPPTPRAQPTPVPSSLRFLALGDSYTVGQAVAEDENYPTQLAMRLAEDGYVFDDLQIIARPGWTTNEMLMGVFRLNPVGPYQLVTLLIGVNDQFRGGDAETYRSSFQKALSEAIDLAGGDPGRVLVLSIPDWGSTPFGARFDRGLIAAQIDAFNAVNYAETMAARARYVDVTAISRMAAQHPDWIAFDSLHPSGEMYRLWVEQMLPVVKEMLGLQSCSDCSEG